MRGVGRVTRGVPGAAGLGIEARAGVRSGNCPGRKPRRRVRVRAARERLGPELAASGGNRLGRKRGGREPARRRGGNLGGAAYVRWGRKRTGGIVVLGNALTLLSGMSETNSRKELDH